MRRRRLLRTIGLGAATGLAGCLAPTADPERLRRPGLPTGQAAQLPVPESALTRGTIKDGIAAVTDPVFADDWEGVTVDTTGPQGYPVTIEPELYDDQLVIGVERDGDARAYPLQVLRFHEIVNDDFDIPVLVSYCPLCRSGIVAERRVRGMATNFGVSGLLWHSDLVMYDERTGSLWSQVAATGIRGPMTGTTLELLPSTMTTLGTWRESHPDTTVLRPAPESGTIVGDVSPNYVLNPYAGQDDYPQIGLGNNELEDDRLEAKTIVLGISHRDAATAYPEPTLVEAGVVNDTVGELPVVVTADESDNLHAYERRVDGERLRFEAAGPAHLQAGGSRWARASGRAEDGPFAGTSLTRATDASPMFWFAWSDFNPDTAIYGQ